MRYIPNVVHHNRTYNKDGTTEIRINCPKCPSNDFWWNPDKGGGHCFACDMQVGSEWQMRKLLQDWEGAHDAVSPKGPGKFDPDEYVRSLAKPKKSRRKRITAPGTDDLKDASWYLKNYRRVDPDKLPGRVRYSSKEDRLYFGLTNIVTGAENEDAWMSCECNDMQSNWRFVSSEGRDKDRYWYNPGKARLNLPIILVEGVFDVLTPVLWSNAIALCGTNAFETVEHALRNCPKVYLWLDPDIAGISAQKKMKRQFGDRAVVISHDKEPGECSKEEAWSVIKKGR